MIRNKLITYTALAAAFVAVSCTDKQLAVTNPNAGDTGRVLGTPNDAEALISTYYKRWSSGVFGSITDLEGMANIFGMMNYSSLANNCQNSHAPFSGATNFNSPGNTCQGEQYRLYSILGEVQRVASNFLTAEAGGLTLGTQARDARAKSWSEFLRGISLGYLALMHDSSAVISPGMSTQDPGVLRPYTEVMDSAYAALQRAIDLATAPAPGTDGFPIPSTWLPSPTSYTSTEFVKLIRSYRARFRANIARAPAERAAANWDLIIADAQNGLTADQLITTSTTTFNTLAWRGQYETFGLWHQTPPFIIGMGDVSGTYASWIAQPVSDRGSGNNGFFMVTPDLRFPQGATRAAQQADFAITSCQAASTPCKRYFVNRLGNDQFAGLGWGWSNYDFVRFHSWNVSGDGTSRNGNTLFFPKAELDMLQAEGNIRKGNYAAAATLINVTRVKNGLPAITAFDGTSPVPGGANCVPKVPVSPFNVIACGNMLEAMKWEKRIETAFVTYSPWFLDGRGWGDLAADTPTFWAVPFQDLQARGVATANIYGAGIGTGNAPGSVAAKGTYGW
jgi:hypothetical protein